MSPVWWRAVTHLTSSLRADGLVWGIRDTAWWSWRVSPVGPTGLGRRVSRCGTALHLRWPDDGLRPALGVGEFPGLTFSLGSEGQWSSDQRIQTNGEPGESQGVEPVRVQLSGEARCEEPSCRKVGPVAPAVQLSEEMERVCPESSSWEPSGATREKEKPPIR